MMDYKDCIEYLYTKLPMFERQGPIGIKKDLTNTFALCERLSNPHHKFKSIHIAGTNGKGSVTHMLASILQEAGYKTGMYISPHYKDFRERIRVNGKFITKKYVIDFVEKLLPVISEIRPSFFEITVAMAFKYFADQKVDIAIIETGLGGRLDSTNVITPLLSIITNISFDHQNLLGNTLQEIASEKAGIIKPTIPILIGEYQKQIISVFRQKANATKSELKIASHLGKVMTQATKERYVYKSRAGKYLKLDMPYHGPYQEKNINTVIQSIQWLNELRYFIVSPGALKRGFKKLDTTVPLIGRFQILGKQPTIIADGGHNIGGLNILFARIRSISRGKQKVHCIFGTVRDKDYQAVLKILPKEFTYYFVKANISRALEDTLLREKASELNLKGQASGSVKNGLKQARLHAKSNDIILITGSIFVVGEVI